MDDHLPPSMVEGSNPHQHFFCSSQYLRYVLLDTSVMMLEKYIRRCDALDKPIMMSIVHDRHDRKPLP